MKHAYSAHSVEFTLCGMAYNVRDVDPDADEVVFAGPGDEVSCEECMRTVNYCLTAFATSYKRAWVKKP